jgi:hypothetical protein
LDIFDQFGESSRDESLLGLCDFAKGDDLSDTLSLVGGKPSE